MDGGDLTQLLARWQAAEPHALDAVIAAAYPELRKLANGFVRRETHAQTIQATGLVHELYLVLLRQRKVDMKDRTHFYSLCAGLMRLILRDRARERVAQKRGGGMTRVPLSEELHWVDSEGPEFLDFDRALTELEQLDARKSRLLELDVLLGCTVQEAAEQLSISKSTAERDLKMARAWLYRRLHASPPA